MLGRGSRRPSAQGTTAPDGVLNLAYTTAVTTSCSTSSACLPPRALPDVADTAEGLLQAHLLGEGQELR